MNFIVRPPGWPLYLHTYYQHGVQCDPFRDGTGGDLPCFDNTPYDYALMICNSNGQRDDGFEIFLNGFDLGSALEPGQPTPTTGNKWFITDARIFDFLSLPNFGPSQNEFACPYTDWFTLPGVSTGDMGRIGCRYNQPVSAVHGVQVVPRDPFISADFSMTMHVVQFNNNGNFGEWWLIRVSNLAAGMAAAASGVPPYPDILYDPTTRMCAHVMWGTYAGIGGQDIQINVREWQVVYP